MATRRSFLSTAAAGLGGAFLLGAGQKRPAPPAGGPIPHADGSIPPVGGPTALRGRRGEDRQLGFAVVGLGGLTMNQIVPALAKTRYARLAGAVTGTPSKGRRMVEEFGLDPASVYDYGTMGRMRDNPDIDVVVVVTPNGLHHRDTLAAAQAGKHVLCEKPMANTAAECEEMIAACRAAGVRLAVGYRCQFEPHHLECMRLARERVFGPVKVIEAGLGFRIGDPAQWRLRRDLAGGGAMMDVGVYALQACRYLSGEEPVRVSAFETKTDPVKFAEVDETMTFQLTFPSGAVGSCTTSYNASGMNYFRAYAEGGSFGMDPAYSYGSLRAWSSAGEIRFDPTDHFAVQMDDFATCILEERESKVPGEEGLRDLRLIEAVYASARSGRVIEVG